MGASLVNAEAVRTIHFGPADVACVLLKPGWLVTVLMHGMGGPVACWDGRFKSASISLSFTRFPAKSMGSRSGKWGSQCRVQVKLVKLARSMFCSF